MNDKTSPDSILILGLKSEESIIEEIAKHDKLVDMLPHHTRSSNTPKVQVGLIPRFGLNDNAQVGGLEWRWLRSAGLSTIYIQRNVQMIAPTTHHFEKPSKMHCNQFLRTANALVDGAEITFIAACCLKHIPNDVRHFYCDTGGINVVAFAIDSIRRRFDEKIKVATVDTFESYEGLKSFDFQHEDESIILISASTSGHLEEEIHKQPRGFSSNRIITIFGVDPSNNGSHTLLVLKHCKEIQERYNPINSYKQDSCPLCCRGSIPVPMMGDQFIPVRTLTKAVLPRATDAPSWLERFMESMGGMKLLRAFYKSTNETHATRDVFIDIKSALGPNMRAKKFYVRLNRMIQQSVPAKVQRIIHLDDEASMLLAEIILDDLPEHNSRPKPEVFSAKDSKDLPALKDGACLIVASAVASGQTLLSVSQRLRDLQKNNAITYLIALTRYDTDSSKRKIENDIMRGEFPNDYAFASAERIYLPIERRQSESSWEEEKCLLEKWANVAERDLNRILEKRINIINNAYKDSVRGLLTDLFWQDCRERDMIVRPGYVYFPKESNANYSQGDVFFTVVSVLHHLRTNGPNPELRQTEYERRVLSPLTFDRFNDGVIQASFLRGAVRPELDYSASPVESEQMTSIIKSILQNAANDKGEASREFVLAIALGRLVLRTSDLSNLYENFGSNTNDLIMHRMWSHISETLLRSAP